MPWKCVQKIHFNEKIEITGCFIKNLKLKRQGETEQSEFIYICIYILCVLSHTHARYTKEGKKSSI